MCVADVLDDAARQRRNVDIRVGRDLTRDEREAGGDKRFARHARLLVLRKNGVEHRVRNLVRNLVRMSFGNGLRREQLFLRHVISLESWRSRARAVARMIRDGCGQASIRQCKSTTLRVTISAVGEFDPGGW